MDSGKIKTGASLCLPLVQRAIRAPGNAPDHTLSTIPRFGKLPCQRLMAIGNADRSLLLQKVSFAQNVLNLRNEPIVLRTI
jgi:hypothetical protein